MHKLLSLAVIAISLTGCHWIHKMDIEQGNVYTPEMVAKLHPGMSKADVTRIMGTPVLLNTFNKNRMDYIYTYQKGSDRMSEKRVTLWFDSRGLLQRIES